MNHDTKDPFSLSLKVSFFPLLFKHVIDTCLYHLVTLKTLSFLSITFLQAVGLKHSTLNELALIFDVVNSSIVTIIIILFVFLIFSSFFVIIFSIFFV